MGRLFWKIFAWFWLASISVFVVTAWSTGQLVRSMQAATAVEQQALERQAEEAAAVLAGEGPRGLYRWIRRTRQASTGERRLLIVRADGQPPGGPPLPPRLGRMLAEAVRDVDAGRRPALPLAAVGSARSEPLYLAAAAIPGGPDGPRPLTGHGRYPEFALLRLGIAVLVSGLGCFLLARHITRPIGRLRAATRAITRGELDTRIGDSLGGRRDELGELGRDFDAMAARVQTLLQSHRQLLRDVSHELRSPLARLQVALGIAGQRGGERIAGELARIEYECEQLDALVGELLSLARMDAEEASQAATPIDLQAMLEELVDDAGFEAEAGGRHVRLQVAQALTVHGDEVLLRRAVENVVRNAIRHAAPAGQVSVQLVAGDADGAALIRVQDDGPGLPADALERIFEPFVRVGEARDRASGGHGLGLAIARRAVQLHGGTISAANADGGGLEVAIHLPAAPPANG